MNLLHIHGIGLETRHIPGPKATVELAPLVFLHEGLGSVSLWTQRGLDWPLALCEATGRAGVVFSRQGYGQSAPSPLIRPDPAAPTGRPQGRLPPDYMHREAWDILPELLRQLGIVQPALVGHSDGASIALLYASRYPVAACIAMAPHVLVEPVALTAIAEARAAYATGGLRQRLARYHADVDGAFWQWNDVWLSEGFRSFDIRQNCRHITAPLMLVQGTGDEYGTLLQLDEIALAAPQAVQLRLADCGHSPHRDQPDQTLEAIASLLETAS